jgi:WD repeat-containing protein 42A
LVNLKENGKKIPLYSISGNPMQSYEFCVSGKDEFIRIYDARKLSTTSVAVSQDGDGADPPERNSREKLTPVKKFCPHHLKQDSGQKPKHLHVTAAAYNYNGKEIVSSYNDENIYLFDATHSDLADSIKVYEGHRNSATGK